MVRGDVRPRLAVQRVDGLAGVAPPPLRGGADGRSLAPLAALAVLDSGRALDAGPPLPLELLGHVDAVRLSLFDGAARPSTSETRFTQMCTCRWSRSV